MTNTQRLITAICFSTALAFCGCTERQAAQTFTTQLTVEKVSVVENLDLPECLAIDPVRGKIYVSNVVTPNKAYWVDDNNGFISLMGPNGKIEKLRWLASSSAMAINDPKGMCVLGNNLYFNDNNKLKRCSLNRPGTVDIIPLAGAKRLNDLATDGESIWVTDTETGTVFCVAPDGSSRTIQGPASINGITCHQGKLFAVSWDLHEIYEL
jgi:DNA-binding beta-propeller fold protein YncE